MMYLNRFLAYLRLQKRASEETLKAYKGDLGIYIKFLERRKLRLSKVRPRHFSEFMVLLGRLPGKKPGQTASRSTISRRISAVASFHEWLLLYSNRTIRSPILKIHRLKTVRGEPNPIPERSYKALKTGVTKLRDRMILLVFLASALRLSELYQLNADSIRLDGYVIDGQETELGVGVVIGKGNKERVFIVDVGTYDEVAEYLDRREATGDAPLFVSNRGARLCRRGIEYVLSNWCKRLGLPPHNIHQLRHTALTRLAELGIPLLQLRELAGHASADTTRRYVKMTRKKVIREYHAAMAIADLIE